MKNAWIRYFDRSYQQIKEQVLTNLGVLVPEITDHTESNLFVRMLSIWSGMVEMLGYYIDNVARETFLSTCRLYWSAVKIAYSYDYRIKASVPSTGSITFTLNLVAPSTINIPIGTVVSNANGLEFVTTELGVIETGEISCIVSIAQKTFVASTNLGISSGNANQSFNLESNVVDNSIAVEVNAVPWDLVETFAYSLNTDTVGKQTIATDKTPILVFGDGVNGLIPPASQSIDITYYITEGSLGNVPANNLTTLVTSLILPIGITATVNNTNPTTGGIGVETIESIKNRIPKQLRTNDRGVTLQDYKDLAELVAGVVKAGSRYRCGSKISVFIVPDGGGIASNGLIQDVEDWLEERKIAGKQILVYSAGEVHITLEIELRILPQFQQILVVSAVSEALQNFLSYREQEISGSVFLSDLYQIIENTEGVSSSDIKVMKPVPYAKIEQGTTVLDWSRELTTSSLSTLEWSIKMTSPTTFEVLRNNVYLGVFNTGSLVTQNEIVFTLNGTYTLGDTWSFFTYPFFGNLVLTEDSIPVAIESDININALGGL